MEQKARLAFEKDIFTEASAYQQKAQTRLSAAEDNKRETMRKQLADIYHRLLKQHGPYVKANFRMVLYDMDGKVDEKSETFKKSYPNSFVRYFFRFVKAL
jgi:hypothetical protein